MSHVDLLSELSPLGLGHRLELGFGEIAKNIWNAQASALAIGFVIAAVAPLEALGQTDIGALTVVSRQAKPKKAKTAHARAPQRPPARRAERRAAPAGGPRRRDGARSVTGPRSTPSSRPPPRARSSGRRQRRRKPRRPPPRPIKSARPTAARRSNSTSATEAAGRRGYFTFSPSSGQSVSGRSGRRFGVGNASKQKSSVFPCFIETWKDARLAR